MRAGGRLVLVPVTLEEANAVVLRLHRHHGPVVGHKLSIGCVLEGGEELAGVAIIGRPVARGHDDGWTLEVLRLATDGTRNACSFLYGAAARAASALGYRRIVTYIRSAEPGASLRAAGWNLTGSVTGRSWNCPARPPEDRHAIEGRLRYERRFAAPIIAGFRRPDAVGDPEQPGLPFSSSPHERFRQRAG